MEGLYANIHIVKRKIVLGIWQSLTSKLLESENSDIELVQLEKPIKQHVLTWLADIKDTSEGLDLVTGLSEWANK